MKVIEFKTQQELDQYDKSNEPTQKDVEINQKLYDFLDSVDFKTMSVKDFTTGLRGIGGKINQLSKSCQYNNGSGKINYYPASIITNNIDDYIHDTVTELPKNKAVPFVNDDYPMQVELLQHVGGEDEGSTYFDIFKIIDKNGNFKICKLEGYYQSYDGTSYDDLLGFFEVKEQQKVVTVYV